MSEDKNISPKSITIGKECYCEDETAFLSTVQTRFDDCSSADYDDKERAMDDLDFLEGDSQWDSEVEIDRQEDGRPCLTINKLPAVVDQITGDQRQNRPQIKVRPVDSESDPKTAQIFEGLIRHIEVQSNATIAYDNGFEGAASCGRGFWRVNQAYSSDDSFDQDIFIKPIKNHMSVYWGKSEEFDLTDAPYMFVVEEMDKEAFETAYPDSSASDFESGGQSTSSWTTDKTVRVAEYFEKVPVQSKLSLLSNGYIVREKDMEDEDIVRLLSEGVTVEKTREVEGHKIVWTKIGGNEILEGPTELPGKYYPIIPVWGKEININGKTHRRGVIRHAKDAQRLYNYHRSMAAETVGLAPKIPYMVTPKQIQGHENLWEMAHRKSQPYLTYNPDPNAPGSPRRESGAQVPAGLMNEVAIASDEIKSTTGIFDASLGAKSNERSGTAIQARQQKGATGSFAFVDNLGRALEHTGRVLVDLIPKIYDTDRIIRIRNSDESEEFVHVNTNVQNPQTMQYDKVNDITVGKYDVMVKVGPSYQTRRQEAAESMASLAQSVPQIGVLAADLIADAMEWEGKDELARRLKKALLPPGLVKPEEGEEEYQPPQPPPDPTLEFKVATEKAKAEKASNDAQKSAVEVEIKKLELVKQKAEIGLQ